MIHKLLISIHVVFNTKHNLVHTDNLKLACIKRKYVGYKC